MALSLPKRKLPIETMPCLSPLFQKGVRVEIETGCSLKSLLCDQWELTSEYVQRRISTLFLNGKPVDDISNATITEGMVLALSSAMPGLVGAVMRKEGFFASLRSGITYREIFKDAPACRGIITVKLFNLLIGEIGKKLFLRGFFVNQRDLTDVLGEPPENSHTSSDEIFIIAEKNPKNMP